LTVHQLPKFENESVESVQPVKSEGNAAVSHKGLRGITTAALVALLVVGLGVTAFAVENRHAKAEPVSTTVPLTTTTAHRSTPTTRGPSPTIPKFNAEAHKSALLVLLDTPPNSADEINRLVITPAKTDPTWVLYQIGIPIPASEGGGENGGFGYAHFVDGKWRNVWGPGTSLYGFECTGPSAPMPEVIAEGFGVKCGASDSVTTTIAEETTPTTQPDVYSSSYRAGWEYGLQNAAVTGCPSSAPNEYVRSDWIKGCSAGDAAFKKQGLVAEVPWAPSAVPIPIGPPIKGAISLVDVPHYLNVVVTVQYSVSEIIPGSGWFALESTQPIKFQALVSNKSKYRDDDTDSLVGRTIDVTGRITESNGAYSISNPTEIHVVTVIRKTSTTVKGESTTTQPSVTSLVKDKMIQWTSTNMNGAGATNICRDNFNVEFFVHWLLKDTSWPTPSQYPVMLEGQFPGLLNYFNEFTLKLSPNARINALARQDLSEVRQFYDGVTSEGTSYPLTSVPLTGAALTTLTYEGVSAENTFTSLLATVHTFEPKFTCQH